MGFSTDLLPFVNKGFVSSPSKVITLSSSFDVLASLKLKPIEFIKTIAERSKKAIIKTFNKYFNSI
jgi:hypothetical protein